MSVARGTTQRVFFFLVLGAATLAAVYVLQTFVFPIFWAVVFALVLRPVYEKLLVLLRLPSLASGAAVACFVVFAVAPLALLATQLARELVAFYQYASTTDLFSTILSHPLIVRAFEWSGYTPDTLGMQMLSYLQSASAWLVSSLVSITTATAATLLKALLTLYLLFFFLRDGDTLRRYLMRRSPLSAEQTRAFLARFSDIARAITRGTLFVAVLQGMAGGILFWAVGVPSPVLWGSVMALLASLPAIGPSLVWAPVGAWLVLSGNIWSGVIVLLVGALIVSFLDNLLRPLLVEKDVQLPAAVILLAILGGIATFGLTGVVIGPLIAAGAIATWDYFADEYAENDKILA